MQNLLKRLKQKYNLKIGEIEFSPIMQCSIGLAMLYVKEVKQGCQVPFHLNYPDKHNAALWLSIALLRNFFLEDYINQAENRIKELNLQPGDKIEIFGAKAKFKSQRESDFCVSFKDGGNFYLPNQYIQHVNKTNRKGLNKYAYYIKKKKELRKERNAISKIIEPDDKDILINDKALTSKILVVAGHGNTGSFRDYLKGQSIYNASLAEVFSKDENIVIKSDLESLKFISEDDDNSSEVFEKAFLHYIDDLFQALPRKKDEINYLKKDVENRNYRTQDFLDRYDEILELVENEGNARIFNVRGKYPGVKENLPSDLKAVVINDFDQVNIYGNTLEELLYRNIPIFIISNRYVEDKRELTLFNEYFSNHESDLRINWNRKKVSELITTQKSEEEFLDKELWENCLKFANQNIAILQAPEHPLDSIISQIQNMVTELDGFEKLEEAYWKYFNPLIYSFKNGSQWREYHEKLISAFNRVYDQLRETISPDLNSLFQQAIEVLNKTKDNHKDFSGHQNIFVQSFGFEGKSHNFPKFGDGKSTVSTINGDTDNVTFPGFPLDEPLSHYLMSSMSEWYISDIQIICWPTEGKLTYNYLRRRLKAGYFFDNIPEDWGFDSKFLMENNGDIDSEIESILKYKAAEKVSVDETLTDEIKLEKISTFKYSGYKKTDSSNEKYLVACNIIDFKDGSFMFLPKNSSILARIEANGSSKKIKKAKFKDLKVGDEIFEYQLSRHDLRELTKNVEGSSSVFNTLDIWKKSLWNSYETCNKDVQLLSHLLSAINKSNSIGASPTRQNIRRWLFDDDMLSPEEENLRVILLADEDKSKVNKIPRILKAFGRAKNLSGQVSIKIKSAIIDKLKSLNNYDQQSFTIDVRGHSINVQYRNIVNLHDTDIEVEYNQTRKFVD